MNLTESKFARVLTMCSMYFAQGMPYGFVTYLLSAYLSGKGHDTSMIGKLTAISILPWTFKFIWGPLVDRFTYRPMGRRRPWILFAQFGIMVSILTMVFTPDITADTRLLFILVFIANVFASLQDVSVDALAVEILKENERGTVNGLMFGSASLGAFFTGSVLAAVLGAYGLRAAIAAQAVMLFVLMLFPLIFLERDGEKYLPWTKGKPKGLDEQETKLTTQKFLEAIVKAFSNRTAIIMIVMCLLVKISIEIHSVICNTLYIQQLGWGDMEFSAMRGRIELFIMFGCFIGGYLADRLGHRRVAMSMTVLFGVCYVAYAFIPELWSAEYGNQFTFVYNGSNLFSLTFSDRLVVQIFFILEGAIYGALSVCLFAICMDISSPIVAGTQFTAYMAMMNLSAMTGKFLAGPMFDGWKGYAWLPDFSGMSYEMILIVMGIFQAVAISVLLLFIKPPKRGGALEIQDL